MIKAALRLAVVLASAFLIVVPNAFGQYDPLCKEIEQAVSVLFEMPQLHRNEASSKGCSIEFERPDLSIDVDVYNTRGESQMAFDRTVRIFRFFRADTPLQDVEVLRTQGTWDKGIVILPSERGSSYVMVLLREKLLITLLAQNKQDLSDMEKTLGPLFAVWAKKENWKENCRHL